MIWEWKMRDNLTKSDIKKMQEEMERRIMYDRPEILERVKEARAQGDLSENFEYYAAKKARNQNESRIRYLDKMIRTANVIDDSSKEDEVGINNTVTILNLSKNIERVFKIVTTIRADSLNGLISIESPMGKALLGHKVGDIVTIKVNDTMEYDAKILNIDKTTDDSNDEIRQF